MKKIYLSSLFIFLSVWAFSKTEKYRLVITDDPATTITIGWNQLSGHSVAVFFDTVDHGQEVLNYPNFQLPDRTVAYKGMNNYFVRLKGLKPATAYYFVVVDNEGVSQRLWFKTLPDNPETPLSIIAGGDSRRGGSATTPHEPRIESNRVVKAIRPDFVAFGGDYTDKDTDGQWQTWFDDWQYTIGDDGRMTPILATRGNHERSNDIVINLFDVPYQDVYYALNFGGSLIRFYTLNVMISIAGEQTQWLEQDLRENDGGTIWKMAQYHYPIAPHQSGKSYKTAQYIHWAPLFYKHNMQLVVECDSHIAKNSWPIKPSDEPGSQVGFIRDDETGTVYTGEGSWGLIRVADVAYDWTRDRGSFTQVKWIHASQENLTVYTIKSASSTPIEAVDDNDRFKFPQGLDIWETENGNSMMITRTNPNYQGSTTNIESEIAQESELISKLYPNPAGRTLRVELTQPNLHTYSIMDIKGRIMISGDMKAPEAKIDIRSLSSGRYFLKLWNSKGQSEVKTFVKQ